MTWSQLGPEKGYTALNFSDHVLPIVEFSPAYACFDLSLDQYAWNNYKSGVSTLCAIGISISEKMEDLTLWWVDFKGTAEKHPNQRAQG